MEKHAREVARGERFEFGKNWQRFLSTLNGEHIAVAEKSLKDMLRVETLAGKTFLDIGSGSGLLSLAARRLGACIRSFDYDPKSVACTKELKRRYYPDDSNWIIEQGSILDDEYVKQLGKFDVVYSWGVLHHTGAMWKALDNVWLPVKQEGKLFIAIYNDQGEKSIRWGKIKKTYNASPDFLKMPFLLLVTIPRETLTFLLLLMRLKPKRYIRMWTQYGKKRGMSRWHDIVDWIGGYPFEVAKPEEIFYFFQERGFVLEELKTCGGGLGNNQYVFRRASP